MDNILSKVKLALRVTTEDFDSEIIDLINSCIKDLGIGGVEIPYETETVNDEEVSILKDELVINAIKTYCKIHFGDVNGAEMTDRLKSSYDEQKAQLSMATGYTDWLK